MEKRGVEGKERNGEPPEGEPSNAALRMQRALDSAASGTGDAAADLEAAAKALVIELRRANEPPEQVLVQIKRILADAGLRPNGGPDDAARLIAHHVALYRSVIESSIRHYFAPDEDPEATNA